MNEVTEQAAEQKPSKKTMAMTVYILYLLGMVAGITYLIGIIMAYVNRGNGNEIDDTHFTFQIRTFWISALYGLIASIISVTVILLPVAMILMIWWFIWALIRNIKGISRCGDGKPIEKPQSWLFG